MHHFPRHIHTKRGLTMLEVVISLGILVFMATMTWQIIAGSLMLREVLEYQDLVARTARVAMDQMEKELRVAYLTSNTQAVNTYRTVFIGKDSGDEDSLWFNTLAHRRKYVGSKEGDQAEITLWVDRGNKETENVLFHRESGRVDQEPEKGGVVLPMVTNVKKFNLRYLDGKTNEWENEWDSTGVEKSNRLPRAVEISLVIEKENPETKENEEFLFINTVVLETAVPMTRSATAGNGGGRKLPI